VLQDLREDFHSAHVLGGKRQALAVHDLCLCKITSVSIARYCVRVVYAVPPATLTLAA
jgi:hypothetical protein